VNDGPGLKDRTVRVHRELVRFVDLHGYIPSYAQLGRLVGCSASTISRHLDKLAEAGLIERPGRKGSARSIVIKVA
jgi:DNA-binding MarR family transcriptional regulator